MKNNFSNSEFNVISEKIGSNGVVRINKSGNIDIRFNNTKDFEWFVLYFTRNKKYLWRRHCRTYYGKCEYPLNMKRDKGQKVKHSWCDGYYWYRPYSVENSEESKESFLSQFPTNIFTYFLKIIIKLKDIFCFCCTKKDLKANIYERLLDRHTEYDDLPASMDWMT